jgi:hypothetical protein
MLKDTTIVVRIPPKKCAKSLIQHCAFIALRGDTGSRLGEANLQSPRAGFPRMEIFCKLGIKYHQPILESLKTQTRIPTSSHGAQETKETLNPKP